MLRNVVVVFAMVALLSGLGNTLTNAFATPSESPIIISKVEPWTPMRFLDTPKGCFEGLDLIDGFHFAWIEVRNTTNETLATTDEFRVKLEPGGSLEFGSLTLDPRESCLITTSDAFSLRRGVGGGEGYGSPPGAQGATVSIEYSIESDGEIVAYKDSTPEMKDPYGDLAYWALEDGKWVFLDDNAPERSLERMTLSSMVTNDKDSIIVNLTLPEKFLPPVVARLDLSFMNSTTMEPIDYASIIYEIEYKGSPLLNGHQRNSGFAIDGMDEKYVVMNQTGTLDIAVKIMALNREATGGSFEQLEDPMVATFPTVTVPEFSATTAIVISAISLTAVLSASRWMHRKSLTPADNPAKAHGDL